MKKDGSLKEEASNYYWQEYGDHKGEKENGTGEGKERGRGRRRGGRSREREKAIITHSPIQ